MIFLLIFLIAIAAGLTAFSQEQTTKSRAKQTQMMFARVKWQAIAVILVVVAAVFAN